MPSLTLEHLNKHPEKKARFDMVVIWSGQWRAWWRLGGSYTDDIKLAEVFPFDKAWATSHHCGPEKKIVYQSLPDGPQCAREKIRNHRLRGERGERR